PRPTPTGSTSCCASVAPSSAPLPPGPRRRRGTSSETMAMDKEAVPYLYLVLALFAIYAPRIAVARAQGKRPEGYDNRHPREQQAKLEGHGARAQAAHQTGFESFAPFAAGVLVCKVAGVDADEIALLAMVHVAARIAYIACYLGDRPTLRSAVWGVGFLASIALLVLPLLA